MKKSPVFIRNIRRLIIVSIVTIAIIIFLIYNQNLNASNVIALDNEFQYNLLSFSGVLAGFLFTGIGILISAIDKERIKRLWDHHYLDNLYYCATLGILTNILDALLALIYITGEFNKNINILIVNMQFILTTLGIVYFIWCVFKLIKLISKMREE